MELTRSFLASWGLLVAAALAGLTLLFFNQQPRLDVPPGRAFVAAPVPTGVYTEPVYSVPQILLGWAKDPGRWLGRTVLVRGSSNESCAIPYSRPDGSQALPCVLESRYDLSGVLYDRLSHAVIPFGQGQVEDPLGDLPVPARQDPRNWDPVAVWRVTLASRRDCGSLGLGRHPCLYGVGVERAGN